MNREEDTNLQNDEELQERLSGEASMSDDDDSKMFDEIR